MEEQLPQVVCVAFIEDGKLLICQSERSQKTNAWTMIGGGVKEGEQKIDAAIRECEEEIGNGFKIEKEDLKEIFTFNDYRESDPTKLIEITIFVSLKKIDVNLIPNNKEILDYHWYRLGEGERRLTTALNNYFVPFAEEKGLLY